MARDPHDDGSPSAPPTATGAAALVETLEERLGYTFREPSLLVQALTHPSYSRTYPEAGPHHQRLEFLGDAVLSAVLADALFHRFPNEREGLLTRRRAVLAGGEQLSVVAQKLGLGALVRLGPGEERGRSRKALREDCLEAIVGAVYLDGGWEAVRPLVLSWFGDLETALQETPDHNPKGRLQELIQATFQANAVRYEVVATDGPDHARHYTVAVAVNGQTLGLGGGSSKKEAEENAARAALASWTGLMRPAPPPGAGPVPLENSDGADEPNGEPEVT